MPSRILRESFVTSESVASLPPDVQDRLPRYFLIADDFGCFLASPPVIRGLIYPLRPDMTAERIADDLRAYAGIGTVQLYSGPDGRLYGCFLNWETHQRPARPSSKRKFPKPPESSSVPDFPANAGQRQQMPAAAAGNSGKCPPVPESQPGNSGLLRPNAQSQSQSCTDRSRVDPQSQVNATTAFEEYLREAWREVPDPGVLSGSIAKAHEAKFDLVAVAKEARTRWDADGSRNGKPAAAYLADWFNREAKGAPIHLAHTPQRTAAPGNGSGSYVMPADDDGKERASRQKAATRKLLDDMRAQEKANAGVVVRHGRNGKS